MPKYDTVGAAFDTLASQYSGWSNRQARWHEMANVIQRFGADEVAQYLIEESGACPVCGEETDGTNIRDLTEPSGNGSNDRASVPYIVCNNDCLAPLKHRSDNTWRPLTGEWKITDLEASARRAVADLITDYTNDLKRVHTSGEQADLGLSEEEQKEIHAHLDEVLAIAEDMTDDPADAQAD